MSIYQTISMPPEQMEWLRKRPEGISQTIQALVRAAMGDAQEHKQPISLDQALSEVKSEEEILEDFDRIFFNRELREKMSQIITKRGLNSISLSKTAEGRRRYVEIARENKVI